MVKAWMGGFTVFKQAIVISLAMSSWVFARTGNDILVGAVSTHGLVVGICPASS